MSKEKIKHPERRVDMSFYHPSHGDKIFNPLIYRALEEKRREDPHASLLHFVSSEGVEIDIESFDEGDVVPAIGRHNLSRKSKHGLPQWKDAPNDATALVAFPDSVEGYTKWCWAMHDIPTKDGDAWYCLGGYWQDSGHCTFDAVYSGPDFYMRSEDRGAVNPVPAAAESMAKRLEDAEARTPKDDVGQHYRYGMTVGITDTDIERGFVQVNIDPYRICDVYQVGGGPREHILKKVLRGSGKGHTERDLIREIRGCVDRWEQMLDEDDAAEVCRP